MSVINPNETARSWTPHRREANVQLYLSGVEGDTSALVGTRVAGFPLALVPLWLVPVLLSSHLLMLQQFRTDHGASTTRRPETSGTLA